jgi:DNA-binding MarR family transcriptional regulator
MEKMETREEKEEKVKQLYTQGLGYREIAEKVGLSISTIHRILKPKALEETIEKHENEEDVARIFTLLEKGISLTEIVISLKKDPAKVKQIYQEWVELKGIDLNEFKAWKSLLDNLLKEALSIGLYRKKNCIHINEEGYCRAWIYTKENGKKEYGKAKELRCAFCHGFLQKKESEKYY